MTILAKTVAAVLLLLIVPQHTHGIVYYVKPDNYTNQCPEPCHTLKHYVQDIPYYFKSNTTFQFLSGHHTLSQTVAVKGIHNLTLVGDEQFTSGLLNLPTPSSQVHCNGSFGFNFSAIYKLFIGNLLISGCGAVLNSANASSSWFRAALSIGDVDNDGSIFDVNISRVTVQNSTGYGLLGNNVYGKSIISNSNFIFNTYFYNGFCAGGNSCFVYMYCPLSSNATFLIESSNFFHGGYKVIDDFRTWWFGRATGLAITISQQTCPNLTINITNITTHGNKGLFAGNMDILYEDLVSKTHIIVTNSRFVNGYSTVGGGAMSLNSIQQTLPPEMIQFINCTFVNNSGTAVFLSPSSALTFQGDILFQNNTGDNGGALLFSESTYMLLRENTSLEFTNNTARYAGGAIWAPSQFITTPLCFYQPGWSPKNIKLNFKDNHANYAGDSVYGGAVDECNVRMTSNWYNSDPLKGRSYFPKLFNVTNTESHKSEISSDPIGVCFCYDNVLDCDQKTQNITAYPGQDFHISVVTVGQRNGTVPGNIIAELPDMKDKHSFLGDLQQSQRVNTLLTCANLTYTVFSNSQTQLLTLKAAKPMATPIIVPDFTSFVLNITLQHCPHGFSLSNHSGRYMCDCDPVLKHHGITCNITSKVIHRKPPVWIGYHKATGQIKSGLLFYPHCPLDYCQPNETEMNLSNPDKQCAFNRSGIICGACKQGLSLTLGIPQCIKCSNESLALILVFAIAGLVLVFILFACNLTVTEGTVNGVIFYANIIWINRSIFFPTMVTNLLTVFIAWLNLDIGIQTCFYHGLDTYARVWLQFVFPFYIWFLVITVVYLSNRSSRVAGLFGNNAVKVLATLFLLSYAKLQRTIIAALSVTFLTYPEGSKQWLWLYDANIKYFGTKHIPLFIAASLALLFLCLPYTFLLLFIQCVRRFGGSRWKIQKWLAKLLPLFDAYTAPYKFQYQFWTGFLLLIRSVLFLVFAFNYGDQPGMNLMATGIACLLIFMFAWSFGGIYQKRGLDILESLFLINLGTTSIATLYTLNQQESQAVVIYISVGAAFAKFVFIIAHHVFEKTVIGNKLKTAIQPFICKGKIAILKLKSFAVSKIKLLTYIPAPDDESETDEDERQPFIPAWNTGCDGQYREPLFEDLTDATHTS